MSMVDWDLLNKRRSCSLLARRAIAYRGTPTTASIIAALQMQEVVKLLHGRGTLLGDAKPIAIIRTSSWKSSTHQAPAAKSSASRAKKPSAPKSRTCCAGK